MKLLVIPALMLSLLSPTFSMESKTDSLQTTTASSKTMQRIDAFLGVLNSDDYKAECDYLEGIRESTDTVLSKYHDKFFKTYAQELIGGSHTLDDNCVAFIKEKIKKYSDPSYGISYGQLYNLSEPSSKLT